MLSSGVISDFDFFNVIPSESSIFITEKSSSRDVITWLPVCAPNKGFDALPSHQHNIISKIGT
jgi:hypothetical protein